MNLSQPRLKINKALCLKNSDDFRNFSLLNDIMEFIDSCKIKAGFRVPEKARHPGAFRVSTPSLGDVGRIRRQRRNPLSLRSFRKAGLNNCDFLNAV